MTTVIKAQPGDSVDDMIRKFKRQVIQDEILTEVRRRERFKKPSEVKKEKLSEFRRKKRRSRSKGK